MPSLFRVAPLDKNGEIIACRLPYESPFDPFDGNRRVLLIDDEVVKARGAIGAKSRTKILESTVNAAEELRTKNPIHLPLSCTSVEVSSTCEYLARYTINPIAYKPTIVRITDPESEFAEFFGQPFSADVAFWPFGRSEERRQMLTFRFTEPLPFGDDTDKSTRMAMEMAKASIKPGWGYHIAGRNLWLATADVVGSRVRTTPRHTQTTKAKAGRRG